MKEKKFGATARYPNLLLLLCALPGANKRAAGRGLTRLLPGRFQPPPPQPVAEHAPMQPPKVARPGI
eukprot:1978003-Pleurochrysis_carterae.AAC.2